MNYICVNTLEDNYNWILYDSQKKAIVFDCGDFDCVNKALIDNSLELKYIVITHTHHDHIQGVSQLANAYGAKVVGHESHGVGDVKIDISCKEGELIDLLGIKFNVYMANAHCKHHCIYMSKVLNYIFVGDVLFNFSCGRIFDGTIDDLYNDLLLFNNMDLDMKIFCGHNYIQKNYKWLTSLDFANVQEDNLEGMYNVPTTLYYEKKYNPFLNIHNIQFQEAMKTKFNMQNISPYKILQYLRSSKDNFS